MSPSISVHLCVSLGLSVPLSRNLSLLCVSLPPASVLLSRSLALCFPSPQDNPLSPTFWLRDPNWAWNLFLFGIVTRDAWQGACPRLCSSRTSPRSGKGQWPSGRVGLPDAASCSGLLELCLMSGKSLTSLGLGHPNMKRDKHTEPRPGH